MPSSQRGRSGRGAAAAQSGRKAAAAAASSAADAAAASGRTRAGKGAVSPAHSVHGGKACVAALRRDRNAAGTPAEQEEITREFAKYSLRCAWEKGMRRLWSSS